MPRAADARFLDACERYPEIQSMEVEMDDRTFVILFFPSLFISLGIFFAGIAPLWWVSIQNRELKRKAGG